MMSRELGHSLRFAAAELAQQIFGLMFQLIEVGADRETAIGHDKPPSEWARGPLAWAKRRFAENRI